MSCRLARNAPESRPYCAHQIFHRFTRLTSSCVPVHLSAAMPTVQEVIPFIPWVPRAMFELLRARLVLVRLTPQQLLALNAQTKELCPDGSRNRRRQDAALERVTFLLPRIAARIPWRSDCLVQALAAQRWLAAHKIASEIEIGVQRDASSAFHAHAWVIQDGKVVLGGETRKFSPLLVQE